MESDRSTRAGSSCHESLKKKVRGKSLAITIKLFRSRADSGSIAGVVGGKTLAFGFEFNKSDKWRWRIAAVGLYRLALFLGGGHILCCSFFFALWRGSEWIFHFYWFLLNESKPFV